MTKKEKALAADMREQLSGPLKEELRAEPKPVDLADVKLVLSLEAPLKTLISILENGGDEAIERLRVAGYPGAGPVGDKFADHDPQEILEAVEDCRIADGNQTVWDYRFLCVRLEFNINQAAKELIGWDAIERIEPLRKYAQSVA